MSDLSCELTTAEVFVSIAESRKTNARLANIVANIVYKHCSNNVTVYAVYKHNLGISLES